MNCIWTQLKIGYVPIFKINVAKINNKNVQLKLDSWMRFNMIIKNVLKYILNNNKSKLINTEINFEAYGGFKI